MNRNPKQHPFTPKKPGDDACKWCPFHQNAHVISEVETWVCSVCWCEIDVEEDLYCPRCAHNYFTPIVKEPSDG